MAERIGRGWVSARRFTSGLAVRAVAVMLSGFPGLFAAGAPPTLTVQLRPPEALAAGAAWRVLGESDWRASGIAYTDLPPGAYFLEFKPLAGWQTPEQERPVWLGESGHIILFPSYARLPLHPIVVTATPGGYVLEQAWTPMGFDAVRSPYSLSSENAEWEAVRRRTPRPVTMPRENAGWRVRLWALAFPGQEFVGWSGDAAGTRNPLTFVVQGPRRIQAHFARPQTEIAATLQAGRVDSPGRARFHAQFGYPVGEPLRRLEWRPSLPAGWKLVGALGLGGPEVQDSAIIFRGPLAHNPIQFNLVVEIPAGEEGRRSVTGEVKYSIGSDGQSGTRPVNGPSVVVQPSAAARLELDLATGQPRLRVRGMVGKTYTFEQTPAMFLLGEPRQLWAFMGDLTLTNNAQEFVDPFGLLKSGSIFYRATIVE